MKKLLQTSTHKPQHQDFHTGLLGKGFIILGLLIILSYIIIQGPLHLIIHGESLLEWDRVASWLSLSLIFIVFGIILFFIHLQLAKLGEIIEELESSQETTPPYER